MNIGDYFKKDKYGILGAQPAPIDFSPKMRILKGIQEKLKMYLKGNKGRVNFIDDINILKEWWLNDFETYNEDRSPSPCNMNDIICHLYLQLFYIQYDRCIPQHKKFESSSPPRTYVYPLVVDACCALASLAGCTYIHLMQDPARLQLSIAAATQTQTKPQQPKTLRDLQLEEEEKTEMERRRINQSQVTPLD